MSRFAPSSVSNLTATVDSINSITLNWVNGENNGCQVERTVPLASADVSPTNFQTLALVAAGVTTYNDPTVQAGSFYVYRVTTLPEADAPMFTPAPKVTVSATTTGVQPHIDTSRTPLVISVSHEPLVILNGTSTAPWDNAATDYNPPIVDPTVNGIPFNS